MDLVAFPNPQRGPRMQLRVKLSGPADGAQVRVYSRGWTLVDQAEFSAALAEGWNRLDWAHADMAAGAYYVQVRTLAREGRGEADRKVVKVVVMP